MSAAVSVYPLAILPESKPEADGFTLCRNKKRVNLQGLSTLQREILALAEEGRRQRLDREALGTPSHNGVDVYHAQLLAKLFDLKRYEWLDADLRNRHGRFDPASHHFDVSATGQGKYDAAKASLSRAVRRLERRGLVVVIRGYCHWAGVALITEAAQ